MRQRLRVEDEHHLLMRSLSVDYPAGAREVAHTHSWPQLLYVQAGAVRVELERDLLIVPPRRGLWIPAGRSHRLTMLGPVSLRTLYCRPVDSAALHCTRVFDVGGLLHELILRICELQWLDGRSANDTRLNGLTLEEVAAAPINEIRLMLPKDSRALQLARNFLDHQGSTQDLASVYSAAGLSRRTAERIYRKETGISPARWYRLARLSLGLSCLSGGGSIEKAALLAGYGSRAAFSSAFSNTFGLPPGTVRVRT